METQRIVYNDKVVRQFIWASVLFGIVGMLVGVVIALQLAFWPANLPPYLSFGRLRPLHTNAVIFAFVGNMLFAGIYYSTQRLVKARLASDILSSIHFWGWQLIIVSAAITLPLGHHDVEGVRGARVADRHRDRGDLGRLRGQLLLDAGQAPREASLRRDLVLHRDDHHGRGPTHRQQLRDARRAMLKSYSVFAGVQDALVQWWYGHNAVAFFLTTPILGIMYYFLPKAAERPVFSYRLSIVHFWGLVFIYIWAGPHHLLYTALPSGRRASA